MRPSAEAMFKSHFPDADIDWATGAFQRKSFWVFANGDNSKPLGEGGTRAQAWRDACKRHSITALKESAS